MSVSYTFKEPLENGGYLSFQVVVGRIDGQVEVEAIVLDGKASVLEIPIRRWSDLMGADVVKRLTEAALNKYRDDEQYDTARAA